MPDKKRLVTSKVCFGSEKAGLLDHSYNKCALGMSYKTLRCFVSNKEHLRKIESFTHRNLFHNYKKVTSTQTASTLKAYSQISQTLQKGKRKY